MYRTHCADSSPTRARYIVSLQGWGSEEDVVKGIEGSTLGRYELRRRVAQGGMSEVYLGYDRRVRRKVAVKVLYGSDEPFVRRFEREALAVGTLSHDNILALYDFGEQRPWYYLVMPYVEGGTLRDYLLRRERLTLEEAASFLDQIASALQYAHDHGVVHRDVKPSNILLRLDGHAYLVDFGLAKAKMEAESLTHAGAMIGTPEYMAPEQSNGLHDYRSDIYSLGIILYQMLTGRVPFTAESPVAISLKHIQTQPTPPRQLNTDIPQSIEDVILKALEKDPNERYQEARILSAAYRKAVQQEHAHSLFDDEILDTNGKDVVLDATSKLSRDTHILSTQELLDTVEKVPLFPLKQAPSPLPSLVDVQWRKKHLRPALMAVCCLFCLSVLIFVNIGKQTVSAPPLKRKHPPQISATHHIVTATATSTVDTQATLAAQSRVQATAGITSSLGAGNILYTDDMTLPGGGWIDDGTQCFFSPQGYHVYAASTYTTHTVAWCYSNQRVFSDVVITAQAQLIHGDIYGIVFRLRPNSRAFYVLEISSQGYYRFVRAIGSDPLNWLVLIDWTYSSAILNGYGQTNTFLIVAAGTQFRFYMNKQLLVTTFVDDAYTSGFIGFLVGGDSNGGTEAIFSNVWVFQK